MSAQTGTPSVVHGPPSSRTIQVAKAHWWRLRNDPNPVWIRELRQTTRLQRTPIILMTLTTLLALLMASIGGVLSLSTAPARTGVVLYHVFFSIAFVVVTLVGPALAANSIASEREGRTWEAVILTGLAPEVIARGKFLSALTSISLYVIMLAPVGALPFLFGGVSAIEIALAFVFLLLFAVLSVAFGLSISSALSSGRVAIVITLLLGFLLTLTSYLGLGVALAVGAHELWPSVVAGAPVWLPTAYARAPWSFEYFALLIVVPLASIATPAWFFYEITLANLRSPSDDRVARLKVWFLTISTALIIALGIPGFAFDAGDARTWFAVAISLWWAFNLFCAFLFQGDALGPSRKVLVHWERLGAGTIRRFLGPGVLQTVLLQSTVSALGFAVLAGVGYGALALKPSPGPNPLSIVLFTLHLAAASWLLSAFAVWVRARTTSTSAARVLLLVLLLVVSVGPWVFAAIAGIATSASSNSLLVVAPSPSYAFVLLNRLDTKPIGDSYAEILAAVITAIGWLVIGVGLLTASRFRIKKVVREHHAAILTTDAHLRQEDEAADQAQAST